jgi:Peptidase_C39 like family
MNSKILSVPYFSQLDNANNPYGTCNLTSVAMCMAYFGIAGDGDGQLEDQLYRWVIAHGLSRHSPIDLAQVFKWKGIKDDFRSDAKWGDARAWIDRDKPLIAHGYFTRSGHIIVITGYDDSAYNGNGAWVVNDPYGEWYEHGYDTRVTGNGLKYSYTMMKDLCGFDGDLWLHFVG